MSGRRIRMLGGLSAVLSFLTACNLLTPIIFVGDFKKKVSPEFDKLADSRVAVLVWTDAATLFDYPYARFELATYIGEKLSTETARRSLNTELVDPRDVEDFVQKNFDARINPRLVGRHFDVDYVLYVEVFEFQIRDAQHPQFLQGKINASTSVYDMHADPDQLSRFDLAPVHCLYPHTAPVLMTATNSPLIREATYRKFAELVARKFYEHAVDL